MSGLSHVDASGAARMVDVTCKQPSARSATATTALRTTSEVVGLLRANAIAKGDAIGVARIAGIMAAKRVPDLIPLAHPIAVGAVEIDVELSEDAVHLTATARTTDRTGIELEALTAAGVAALALYDMVKAVDPAAVIGPTRLEAKDGGRSGAWRRPADR